MFRCHLWRPKTTWRVQRLSNKTDRYSEYVKKVHSLMVLHHHEQTSSVPAPAPAAVKNSAGQSRLPNSESLSQGLFKPGHVVVPVIRKSSIQSSSELHEASLPLEWNMVETTLGDTSSLQLLFKWPIFFSPAEMLKWRYPMIKLALRGRSGHAIELTFGKLCKKKRGISFGSQKN